MRETMSWQKHNMTQYFEASKRYGVVSISRSIVKWLESSFLELYEQDKLSLKNISSNLMTNLVACKNFTSIAGKELYPLLRTWLYFMMFPAYTQSDSTVDPSAPAAHYFLTRPEKSPFLLTEIGCKFSDPFKVAVELKRFESSDWISIKNDNIIPEEWFLRYCWLCVFSDFSCIYVIFIWYQIFYFISVVEYIFVSGIFILKINLFSPLSRGSDLIVLSSYVFCHSSSMVQSFAKGWIFPPLTEVTWTSLAPSRFFSKLF